MWKPRERILHFIGLLIVVELRWALEMIRTLIHLISVYWVSTQRRQWHPTAVPSPGKSHGWRSLVGCSPWGRKESDTIERLHFHFSLSCIGEGNGNPLQCSCLENPRDGGAWWLPSMGSHRVGHDWSDLAAAAAAVKDVTKKELIYSVDGHTNWCSHYGKQCEVSSKK